MLGSESAAIISFFCDGYFMNSSSPSFKCQIQEQVLTTLLKVWPCLIINPKYRRYYLEALGIIHDSNKRVFHMATGDPAG